MSMYLFDFHTCYFYVQYDFYAKENDRITTTAVFTNKYVSVMKIYMTAMHCIITDSK